MPFIASGTSARLWSARPAEVFGSMSSSRRPTSSKARTNTTQSGRWARKLRPARLSITGQRSSGPGIPAASSGILHVKCVVADGRWLFLSSANLTDYAFTINMELGLLITGGDLPNRIERHFDRLIDLGTLAKL